jgi:hypothetical protein
VDARTLSDTGPCEVEPKVGHRRKDTPYGLIPATPVARMDDAPGLKRAVILLRLTIPSNDRVRVDVCIVAHGRVLTPSDPLTCACCGQVDGPWLVWSSGDAAGATCKAGHRSSHPTITPEEVAAWAEGCQATWPSLEDAERGLGFHSAPRG